MSTLNKKNITRLALLFTICGILLLAVAVGGLVLRCRALEQRLDAAFLESLTAHTAESGESARELIEDTQTLLENAVRLLEQDGRPLDKSWADPMLEMVNRFNEQHEDIVVRVKPGNGNPYDEILKTLESVGEFPDILETYNVAAYVRAGMLAELPEDIIALFKNPVSIDGKVYTAPQSNNNTLGIVYNKKYFAENGLEEPRTYDEFKELCRRIGEMGDMYPLVVGAQDLWHIGFWFHKIYSDQVTSLDPDFIMHCYEGSRDFSDISFRRALEEMREMIQYAQPEWASTPDAQVASYLIQGRAAMLYSGGHMLLTIPNLDSDFEIGWFAIPSPDGKLRMTGGAAANGFAISAEAARNPVRKAAAEEFIRFFFAKENYQYYCDARDIVPTTVDAPERQYSDLMKKMMEALESADEVGPMWNNEIGNRELPFDFRNFTYKTVIEVLQGKRDIDSACEEINKIWESSTRSFNPLKKGQ